VGLGNYIDTYAEQVQYLVIEGRYY